MAWIKKGDTWNDAPEWMRAHELAASRGDDRLVNELKGAAEALFAHSAQQWTDYVVTFGAAVHHIGLSRVEPVLADLKSIGIISERNENGERVFVLVERESFEHLIRSDSKAKATKRRNDQRRGSLQVPVLLRDGDQCRYCADEVVWGDNKSDLGREYDHRDIDAPTTPDNYVTTCRGCNQLRHELGDRAEEELPLLDPPANPVYGPELLKKLSRWAPLVSRWCKKEGIPNPLEAGEVEAQDNPAASRAVTPSPTIEVRDMSPAAGPIQVSGKPQFPDDSQEVESKDSRKVESQDSFEVESEGRAAKGKPQQPAVATDESSVSSPLPEPNASQASGDPQGRQASDVCDAGPANGADPSARRRRRRRRK